MKQGLRKIFTSLTTISLLIHGAVIPVSAENVFEEAIPGWVVIYRDGASGSVSFEDSEKDKAVVVSNSGSGDVIISQAIPTIAGRRYECSAILKTTNAGEGYLFGGGSALSIKSGTNNLSDYRLAFTAKSDTTEIGVMLRSGGSISIDNITVADKDGNSVELVNGEFNEGGTETNSASSGNLSSADKTKMDWNDVQYFYQNQKVVPLFYAEGITVDGNIEEWANYPSVYMPVTLDYGGLASWTGEADNSGNIYMAYDEEYFYFCADLIDDKHEPDRLVYWKGDDIQLGFTDNVSYGPEIGIYFDNSGNYIDSPIGKEELMTLKCKREGTRSVYEYKIPWTLLYPEIPDYMMFNVCVNDCDDGVRGFMEWTDGIAYGKSADSIRLEFIDKESNDFACWTEIAKEATVNEAVNGYVNFMNRSDETLTRTVKIPLVNHEETVEISPKSVYRIPFTYASSKAGKFKFNVAVEGDKTSYIVREINIKEKNKYQGLDLTNLQNGKLDTLKKLIEECKAKGIATDYQEIDLNVIERFMGYYQDDLNVGRADRAEYVANNLERIADEAIDNLQGYLNGTKDWESVPLFNGGKIELDGYNVIAETRDSLTGETQKRPVFFAGYGHTLTAIDEFGELNKFGTNIGQFETGPRHNITGYSDTPDAENIMDRFIYTDAGWNVRVAKPAEEQKITGQALDLILSPHYFPQWVTDKYPDEVNTLKTGYGMFGTINIMSEPAKEVVEAHVRFFLRKIKEEGAQVNTICLTNEPAFDTRNIYEPKNPKNECTAAWGAYLEEIHGSLSVLNKRYKSDYKAFTDVPMPEVYEPDPLTYDWYKFNNKWFADWHAWLAEIVKEEMPEVKIHSKIMDFIYSNAVMNQGTDHELFAEFCDIMGNDAYFCYPTTSPMGKFMWYDFQGSMKEAPIFDSENHIITDEDENYVPEHAYQNSTDLWQGALHGRALTAIWVWGRDEVGALAGSLLFRPDVVSRLGHVMYDLQRCSYEVAAINDEPFRIGVMYSHASRIYETSYMNSFKISYQGASYSGEKVNFITEKQLAERNFKDYEVIIVPYVPNTFAESVEGLAEFIKNGGKVFVMGGNSLTRTEHNEPIYSEALGFVQANAEYWDKEKNKSPTEADVRNYLFEYYDKTEGTLGDVRVIDAKTGEEVKTVEWRSTEVDGEKIINMCSYTWDENREVYITVDGKRVRKAYDIKNLESLDGYITLNSYEPRMIRVEEYTDIDFEDIKNHWSRKDVEKMTLTGVLNGVSNTEFQPDRNISAQELLAAVMRFKGIECEYAEVFEKAKQLWNIDDRFAGKETLTREELAELVCTVCGIYNENADISFMEDVKEISEGAYGFVATLYEEGAMTGRTDTTINPKDIFTRAEAVTVISRIENLLKQED